MNVVFKVFSLFIMLFFNIDNCFADTDNKYLNFFEPPDMVMAKISPAGESIVAIRYKNQHQQVTLINAVSKKESLLLDLQGIYKESASISQLAWIDEQHIAAQLVVTKKGIEDLLDTKTARRLLIIKKPEASQKTEIYSVRTKGWLVNPLSEQQGIFLYAKSSLYSKVYQLNVNKLAREGKKLNKLSKVDGGQFKASNEVKSISGYAVRWFFDHLGTPKAVLYFDGKRVLTLSSFAKNDAVNVLKAWPDGIDQSSEQNNNTNETKLVPMELSSESHSFYSLDLNEEEKRTVYLVNYKTGKKEIVYEADSYEIIGLERSQQTGKLTSVKVINNGVIENIFIDVIKNKTRPNHYVLNTEINADFAGKHSILYRESYRNSGQFYLQSGSEKMLIGEKYPHLTNKIFSRLVESNIDVNGLKIPYILSLPEIKTQSYPLVVMPHGGPIGVFDSQSYNPIVQFLVANGFAVLQVNFRGSGGYSQKLKAAGKNQWADLMLEDIYQATLAVGARADINKQNICSFGMSYGGYAALMLAVKYPQLYKCAANWAGVTDLSLYVNNPRLTKAQKAWIKKHVGVIDWSYEKLKANSPVFLVEKIQAPVFIAHGRKDKIVDIENAYRMKLMLEKYNKNFQWYEDKKGTHSFGTLSQSKVYFSQLAEFLSTHIQ